MRGKGTYVPSTLTAVNGSLDSPRFPMRLKDANRTRNRTHPVSVRKIGDPRPAAAPLPR